jgi:hypothetical protein
MLISYLGCIRIPCLIQMVHFYIKYKWNTLYTLSIFIVYEEVALGILIWARVKWVNIEDCDHNVMFNVLFAIMYVSFFIIGRAGMTLILVALILIISFISCLRNRTRARENRRMAQNLPSIKFLEIPDNISPSEE